MVSLLLPVLAYAAALHAPLARAEDPPLPVFSGTAKSASTGDFVPNKCGYEEFSTQFVSAGESRFAYVSSAVWDADEVCGRCASVSLAKASDAASMTPNSTITVMLISHFEDECSGGGGGSDSDDSSDTRRLEDDEDDCSHDLLLSEQAYRDMLNQGSGSRFSVEWQLVECPTDFVDGGIEFVFDDATTSHLLTVQPRNFHGAIESMEVQFEDGDVYEFGPTEEAFGSFRRVVLPDTKHNFSEPFTLVATQLETQDTISFDVTEQPVPNQVIVTDAQF